MLKENIDKKVSLLDRAVNVFYEKILLIEKRLLPLISSFLGTFETDNGRYKNISSNRRKLLSIDKAILALFGDAKLDEEVTRFLKNFDDIERINRLIYEGFLDPQDIGRLSRLDFDIQKLEIIDQVVLGLTSDDVLKNEVIKPIRSLIIQSVARERTVKETEDLIRSAVISSDGSQSKLLRHTRQIAQDALSQYDGALNDGIRDELKLDGMFYLGTVIKSTRQNCFDLVRGVGKYKDLAIRPGVYRVADIPKIIERATRCEIHHSKGNRDCGSGFNSSVTPETFGTYRMGYGCLHSALYFRLLDDDVPRGLRNI